MIRILRDTAIRIREMDMMQRNPLHMVNMRENMETAGNQKMGMFSI